MNFKLGLIGHYWDKVPAYQIVIDDNIVKEGQISAESGTSEIIDFDLDLAEGDHVLKVRFTNKTNEQTVKDNEEDPDNYEIVKDMTLEIDTIEVDQVDLGEMKWDGIYRVDKPVSYNGEENVTEIQRCTNMGWNGQYEFRFSTPFYLWLLDNI